MTCCSTSTRVWGNRAGAKSNWNWCAVQESGAESIELGLRKWFEIWNIRREVWKWRDLPWGVYTTNMASWLTGVMYACSVGVLLWYPLLTDVMYACSRDVDLNVGLSLMLIATWYNYSIVSVGVFEMFTGQPLSYSNAHVYIRVAHCRMTSSSLSKHHSAYSTWNDNADYFKDFMLWELIYLDIIIIKMYAYKYLKWGRLHRHAKKTSGKPIIVGIKMK